MKATIQKYGEYTCTDGNNDVLNGIQEVTKYLNLGMLQIMTAAWKQKKNLERMHGMTKQWEKIG